MYDSFGRCMSRLASVLAVAILLSLAGAATYEGAALAQSADSTAEQSTGGQVPGNSLGSASDADLWRAIREGAQGNVSTPNKQSGTLIQSEGDNWRAIRNGPLSTYGVWVLLGMIILLALFFAIRGRIRIEGGESGRRIERFNFLDRVTHWTTATSFVILALTGMNVLWGKYVLLPVIGPSAFSAITTAGKYLHNYVAFAFMLGIVVMFVLWVGHNIPNRYDLKWIAKGGGMFGKNNHPPARKFNAGQKVVFWVTILGGLSLSLSGIALLFPFETTMWGKTFGILSAVGFNVPGNVTLMEEQQLSSLWHAVVGIVMIAVILAHIYIGTLGMEGAFDAMGTGYVDENWAREHHSVWVAEVKNEPLPGDDSSHGARTQPAE